MTSTVAAAPGVQRDGTARSVVDRLARLGLGARGVVYLLVGWLALRVAFQDGSGRSVDRQGALREIASTTGGVVVLVVMAVGFAGYAVWRATEALWGHRDCDGGKRLVKRLFSAGRAVLYAGFAVSTARTAFGGGGSSSDRTSRRAAGGLLGMPAGRWLVLLAGAVFVVAGAVLAVRGVLRKFESKLKTGQMGRRTRAVVDGLGVAGQTARGVVFAMVGGFLIDAAATYDPTKARGLDGALKTLAQGPWGKAALAAVALGLAAFGLYSLAEARYRKTAIGGSLG